MRQCKFLIAKLMLLAGTLLYVSCEEPGISGQLSSIESYIDTRPDSALVAIRQIDTTALRRRSTKAKYSLLQAMALDKNYIDTADTRVVQPAVDWYSRHGNPEEKLKAWMYLGTEQYNKGDYREAIVSLSKALESANLNEDILYLGILYARLAETYSITRDYSQASHYIDLSVDCFQKAGRMDLQLIERHKKAQNLVNLRKWDIAETYYSQLLRDDHLKSPLKEKIECDYAMTLLTSPDPDDDHAFDLLSAVFNKTGHLESYNQYGAFAYLLYKKGFKPQSDSLMLQIRKADENVFYDYWSHRIEKEKGDFRQAYYSLWSSMSLSDSLINAQYSQSVSNAQREYQEQKSHMDSIVIRTQKLLLITTTLLILLSVVLVLVLIKWKYTAMKEETERKSLIISSLESDLVRVAKEKDEYALKLEDIARQKTKAKFTYLAKLFEIMNQIEGKDVSNMKSIYFRIESQISSLRADPKARKRFEDMLNAESGNLMKRFRDDFPDLSDDSYRLASLVFAGFDNTTLMLLLGKSSTNTRTLKNRLRKRIALSSAHNREEFLKYFPQKVQE